MTDAFALVLLQCPQLAVRRKKFQLHLSNLHLQAQEQIVVQVLLHVLSTLQCFHCYPNRLLLQQLLLTLQLQIDMP